MTVRLTVDGESVPVLEEFFPAGESMIRVGAMPKGLRDGAIHGTAMIDVNFESNNDLINMLLVTDAVRRSFIGAELRMILSIPYLPYARQDRVCAPGEPLSIRVIADLINAQKYAAVMCSDAHSEAAGACIDRLFNVGMPILANSLAASHPEAILVSPDAGANKKVFEFAKQYGFEKVVRADKTRNPATGQITGTEVFSGHVGGRDFLIMDDICDGGRTFVELAKKLRELTSGRIYLYVTHGIFSKGAEVFGDLLDGIYVSNLMGAKHPLIKEI